MIPEEIFDYNRFDEVLDFTYGEILKDLDSSDFKDLLNANMIEAIPLLKKSASNNKRLDLKPRLKDNKSLINARVKYKIGTLTAGSLFPCVPFRGDNEYLYYYDIWGNVYFGYLMAAAEYSLTYLQALNRVHNTGTFVRNSFPNMKDINLEYFESKREALAGNLIDPDRLIKSAKDIKKSWFGNANKDDQLSLEIGHNLFVVWGFNMSKADIQNELAARRNEFSVNTTKVKANDLLI